MLVDYRDSKAKQATFCQGHAIASKMCSLAGKILLDVRRKNIALYLVKLLTGKTVNWQWLW